MEQIGQEIKPRRASRSRKTPEERSEAARRRLERSGVKAIEGAASFLSAGPVYAADIVNLWGVPQNQISSVSVLVFKQREGDPKRDLLAREPLTSFDLFKIVGQTGPGTYYIRGVPGPFAGKIATVHISDYMARESGWGKMPDQPSAVEMQAVRTLERASQNSGVDPIDYTAALQVAVGKILEQYGIRPGQPLPNPTYHQAPIPDPMDQLVQMEKILNFSNRLEERATEMAERRLGIKQPEEQEQAGVMGTVNIIGSLLLEFMKGRNQPQAQAMPANVQPFNQQPQPAQPVKENPAMEIIQQMTPEEKQNIQPVLRMLHPFKGMLLSLGSKPGLTADQKAEELAGFIPDAFAENMMALHALKIRLGFPALAIIDPAFATQEWGNIVDALATVLIEKFSEGENV